LDHPIFKTPNEATFEWVERKRPKHYEGMVSPLYPEGVPETYRLALFEKSKPDGWNPTIVSHEGFFTDIPGFENLAEGNSGKMLGSLALARQGRYFYWGYSADPDKLTPGARATLLNVLHYMHGKRHSRTVPFVCNTRRILWVYTRLGRESGYKRGVEEHFPNSLVPEWRETYTPSFEGAEAWVAKYLPYVFSGKAEEHKSVRYKCLFEVDADAMELKTPNDKRESLERWIELAEGKPGKARERSRRCLERYVHPDIRPKGNKWKRWYERQRDRIAFIESTGFWWQEDPEVLEREAAAKRGR
ncbi:MAG: hypothetical protein ACYTHK_13470, partial [Planctomycetota bacterium]